MPHNDQSVLKGIDDTSIMINNKSINIKPSKDKKLLHSKKPSKEESKDIQQPKIIKVNNLNQSQINS